MTIYSWFCVFHPLRLLIRKCSPPLPLLLPLLYIYMCVCVESLHPRFTGVKVRQPVWVCVWGERGRGWSLCNVDLKPRSRIGISTSGPSKTHFSPPTHIFGAKFLAGRLRWRRLEVWRKNKSNLYLADFWECAYFGPYVVHKVRGKISHNAQIHTHTHTHAHTATHAQLKTVTFPSFGMKLRLLEFLEV